VVKLHFHLALAPCKLPTAGPSQDHFRRSTRERSILSLYIAAACLICGASLCAQQQHNGSPDAQPSADSASPQKVPQLIRFSGMLRDLAGQPLTGAEDVHFAIYKDEADTEAIWER